MARLKKPTKRPKKSAKDSGYEYDFFVSFTSTSKCGCGEWCVNHFIPLLEEGLRKELPEPRIYAFTQQPGGRAWPAEVKTALLRTKFLIAITCPGYFKSEWCWKEWRTMMERQSPPEVSKKKRLQNTKKTQALVLPVRYSDGYYFPPDAKSLRDFADFRGFDNPDVNWRQSPQFMNSFRPKMMSLCKDLSLILAHAPPWRMDFPLVESPEPPAIPEIGRFERL